MAISHKLWWWLVAVVMLLLTIVKPGTTETNNNNNNNNDDTVFRSFCDRVDVMSPLVFFSNLNTTLASLRRQLSSKGVYFATAQKLGDADSVYGTAQCRRYLSEVECTACFDEGVSAVRSCTSGNGAYAVLDGCFLRPATTRDDGGELAMVEKGSGRTREDVIHNFLSQFSST